MRKHDFKNLSIAQARLEIKPVVAQARLEINPVVAQARLEIKPVVAQARPRKISVAPSLPYTPKVYKNTCKALGLSPPLKGLRPYKFAQAR